MTSNENLPSPEKLPPELAHALGELSLPPLDDKALVFEDLQGELEKSSTLRELPVVWRFAIVTGAALFLLGGLFLNTWFLGHPSPTPMFFVGSGVLLIGIVLGLKASLRPVYKAPLRSEVRWGWLALCVGFLGLATLGPLPLSLTDSASMPMEGGHGSLGCFLYALGAATPIFAIWWVFYRAGYSMVWHVVFASISAALVGFLSLNFHCPSEDRFHLMLGHLGSVVAFSCLIIGVVLVQRWRQADA